MPPSATRYVSLGTFKYEEVMIIQHALDVLAGNVNDMEGLSQIDSVQKKIKFILEQSKVSYRT